MLTADELDQLADDLLGELPDAVTVRYQDGTTLDPDTLEEVPNYVDRHIGLPALIAEAVQSEKVVETGDGHSVLAFYECTVPAVYNDTATVVKVGDQVVVTTSYDGQTEDSVLTVKDVGHGSLSISRRLLCQLEQG